jgi:alpha-galactosidase
MISTKFAGLSLQKALRGFACFLTAAALLVVFAASACGVDTASGPDSSAAVRTPAPKPTPRINGPRVYGVRPGHPFFYHLPVSGQRPMSIVANNLPDGLALDASTGNITGRINQPGETIVNFTAANSAGRATAKLRIIAGATICLTPPMGWNSWNCFHTNIDRARISGAADAMVATGLIDHGWTYVNMDDCWEGRRDAAGNIQPSQAIGDVPSLSSYIHAKGLKFGLYTTPGPQTCAGRVGSYGHEEQDAATYASWNADYLKYDGCTIGAVLDLERGQLYAPLLSPEKAAAFRELSAASAVLEMLVYNRDPATLPQNDAVRAGIAEFTPLTPPQRQARRAEIDRQWKAQLSAVVKIAPPKTVETDRGLLRDAYAKMGVALQKVNRDIVFSLSIGHDSRTWEWGASAGGNLWRISTDINASWSSIDAHAFNNDAGLEAFAGPGHWNDPDMLEIGNGKLTTDEAYTQMTMWCILSAPLLIGCDMTKMTPITISIFSNDEVIAIDQDALGRQGTRVVREGNTEVWAKPLCDGTQAVALLNRGQAPAQVSVTLRQLHLSGAAEVRDLWRQQDLPAATESLFATVAPHGAELFKVGPPAELK